jgi:DNA-binding MarR family transcriptional regulator
MLDPAQFREAVTQLSQRFNALQRGEKCCFGVTMSQCMTLELLHQRGRCSVRELAEGLALDTSTVTRVVDVLVRDGLVRRARDEKRDRRRVFVSLSERGRRLAKKLETSADEYCARILERIPPGRHAGVLDALLLVVTAIDEMPEVLPDSSG